MKIGVNTLFLVPGDVGGTEIYLRNNLKEMVDHCPEHTFVVFTNREDHGVLMGDLGGRSNVLFRQVPVQAAHRPLRIIAEQTLLPFSVFRSKVDVLWSPGYTTPFFVHCPQVVTIHDLQYKTYPEDMSRIERWTLDFLVRGACRQCQKVIAVSDFSKRELVRFNFVQEERVEVVYEGVDTRFETASDLPLTKINGRPIPQPYILCVAHSYPHKNVNILVEAYAAIQREIPHHLLIVGKPRRGEKRVQDALAKVDDPGRVHRIDEGVTFTDLLSLYGNADLFVLPSVYEGFGLPVAEAMMAGVPVVTTSYGSLPEVGGKCTRYVSETSSSAFAETILNTLSFGSGLREKNLFSAREWARQFNWPESASKTLKVLLSVS